MNTNNVKKNKLCNREKCTACLTCAEVCPVHCINVESDNFGNIIPVINEEKCINCGKCQISCPIINQIELNKPKKIYAAYSNSGMIHQKAASGGIATEFAKIILENGGVVYGAAQTRNLNIEHIRVDDIDSINKIMGSKYVHSHNNGIYKKVESDLNEGVKVLYVGTPCQISGLKKYLGGKAYENLFCIDLVCHGVPSQKTFIECMKYETREESFEGWEISFRDNNKFEIKLLDKSHNIKHRLNLKNSFYYNGFMEGYIYRRNCYSCIYARPERVGDITLGDFWGLGDKVPFHGDKKDGVNVVLVNTEHGVDLFKTIKEKISFWERTLEEAQAKNGQLNRPSAKSKYSEKFSQLSAKNSGRKNGNAKAVVKCNKKKYYALKLRKRKSLYNLVEKCFKRSNI